MRLRAADRLLPLDRDRLARLPGHPPPDVPLVCLDTETTGLATAAGTLAFLVGLGWWEADRFRQAQLLLPDQPDEPALLAHRSSRTSRRTLARDLQRPRFRLAPPRRPLPDGAARPAGPRRPPGPAAVRPPRVQAPDDGRPAADGRDPSCSGVDRHEDVDGWEIPGRYLDFLRSGLAAPLLAVVRAQPRGRPLPRPLLVHVEAQFADEDGRRAAHRGDLAGLARRFLARATPRGSAWAASTPPCGGVRRRLRARAAADRRSVVDAPAAGRFRRPAAAVSPAAPTPPGLALDGGADPRRARPRFFGASADTRQRRGVGGARRGHRPDRQRSPGSSSPSCASIVSTISLVRSRPRAGPATSSDRRSGWAGLIRRSISPRDLASSDSCGGCDAVPSLRGPGQLTAAEAWEARAGRANQAPWTPRSPGPESRSGIERAGHRAPVPSQAFR